MQNKGNSSIIGGFFHPSSILNTRTIKQSHVLIGDRGCCGDATPRGLTAVESSSKSHAYVSLCVGVESQGNIAGRYIVVHQILKSYFAFVMICATCDSAEVRFCLFTALKGVVTINHPRELLRSSFHSCLALDFLQHSSVSHFGPCGGTLW